MIKKCQGDQVVRGSNPLRPVGLRRCLPEGQQVEEKGMKFDVTKHKLVPEHIILSDTEVKKVLKRYNIKLENLPKILASDPAIKELDAKPGQVIKIVRESPTAKTFIAYRQVVVE